MSDPGPMGPLVLCLLLIFLFPLQRPSVPVAPTPPPNIYMSPVQKKLHDQLQQKARQVQDAILRQQEELRTITEQLSFAKQGSVPLVNQTPGESFGNMAGLYFRSN